MRTFQMMLRPGEPNDVHRAALRGLGNLDDPHLDEDIAGSLSDPIRAFARGGRGAEERRFVRPGRAVVSDARSERGA